MSLTGLTLAALSPQAHKTDSWTSEVSVVLLEFGDRVKYWVTLNETWTYAHHGYALCIFPPSIQGLLPDTPTDGSDGDGYVTYRIPKNLITIYDGSNGDNGLKYDPAKDTYNPKNAYIVAKYLFLAHAEAVKSYRTKFQLLEEPSILCWDGVDEANDHRLIPSQACIDPVRIKYHQDHLANLLRAMKQNHVNVKGYFAWSWCDNFEWAAGYESRFGFMYVDYKNKLIRYAKDSAMWFANFLMKKPNPPPNKRTVEVVDTESKKKLRAMEE
ncbi:hypothetical protein BUALT_BualtUnG0031400 [Buddleja alternifolia]|uniref:Beta-glucosidase n=1 Tax=Buddleja alternifolia TaxID=168488 RepID=A0AAV6W7E7_9LAMI|nr:hypothetical protein BUALT_BualtUnG0031400 [Buddleja alternifolia]